MEKISREEKHYHWEERISLAVAGDYYAFMFFQDARKKLGPFVLFDMIEKIEEYNITGVKLGRLWNECLRRDTVAVAEVMLKWYEDDIYQKINYRGRHGYPISRQEIANGRPDYMPKVMGED